MYLREREKKEGEREREITNYKPASSPSTSLGSKDRVPFQIHCSILRVFINSFFHCHTFACTLTFLDTFAPLPTVQAYPFIEHLILYSRQIIGRSFDLQVANIYIFFLAKRLASCKYETTSNVTVHLVNDGYGLYIYIYIYSYIGLFLCKFFF